MLEPAATMQRPEPEGTRRHPKPGARGHEQVHTRLPRLFSSSPSPGSPSDASATSPTSSPSQVTSPSLSSDHGPPSLASPRRTRSLLNLYSSHSYSKMMHMHTASQLSSPHTGTLPSYTKTMYAFTLNQLIHHQKSAPHSAELSPALYGAKERHVMLPTRIESKLSKLRSVDKGEARGPPNTPETPKAEPLTIGTRGV